MIAMWHSSTRKVQACRGPLHTTPSKPHLVVVQTAQTPLHSYTYMYRKSNSCSIATRIGFAYCSFTGDLLQKYRACAGVLSEWSYITASHSKSPPSTCLHYYLCMLASRIFPMKLLVSPPLTESFAGAAKAHNCDPRAPRRMGKGPQLRRGQSNRTWLRKRFYVEI